MNNEQLEITLDLLDLADVINNYGYTESIDNIYGDELRASGINTNDTNFGISQQIADTFICEEGLGSLLEKTTKILSAGGKVTKILNAWFLLSMVLTIGRWLMRATKAAIKRSKHVKRSDADGTKWRDNDTRMKIFERDEYVIYYKLLKEWMHITDSAFKDDSDVRMFILKYKEVFELNEDGHIKEIKFHAATKPIYVNRDGNWSANDAKSAIDKFDKLLQTANTVFVKAQDQAIELEHRGRSKVSNYNKNAIRSTLRVMMMVFRELDSQTDRLYKHYAKVFNL